MTKIKTFSATVLLFAAVAAPVFAQDGGVLGSSYGWEPISSANSEKPGIHPRMRNSESSVSNSKMTEPGDFAVTGGPVQSQQSVESHRRSRSRHKQQPSWERRR